MQCPTCGAAVSAEQRFCESCGAPLGGATPSVATPGKRVITALFTDISGFTAMSENLDPEDLTNILNAFFKVLVDPIYRYGGVVDKYIGDAVMAVFGAPVAHEDDAIRACMAAWDMQVAAKAFSADLQRRTGLDLKIRIGLNTGVAVYASIGSHYKTDTTVMGDTVNVAQRMESHAQAGKVLVSGATRRAIGDAFVVRELPPVKVKGKAAPVECFELERPQTQVRLHTHRAEPLIGRTAELGQLEAAYKAASAGKPQIAAISGEAGIGKSAVVRHFLHGAQARGAAVIRARAQSLDLGDCHSLVGSVVEDMFSLTPDLSAKERVARIAEHPAVRRSRHDQAAALLAALTTADMPSASLSQLPPQALKDAAYAALSDALIAASHAGTLVVSLANLQWADAGSLGWVEQFAARLSERPDTRILVVCQARSDAGMKWPDVDEGLGMRILSVGPLGREEARALALAALDARPEDVAPPVARLLDRVVERSDGNPFYLTEMLRQLVDDGVGARSAGTWVPGPQMDQWAVPTSVRSAIAARLDRLDQGPRDLVQLASVLGRRFDAGLLRTLGGSDIEGRLARLIDLKLFGALAHDRLEFSQAVVQEVAYDSMLGRQRSALHRRVAETIEQGAAQLDPLAPLLAHHYSAGEVAAKAIHYLVRAAELAMPAFAVEEAAAYLRRAVDLHRKAPDAAVAELPPRKGLLVALALAEWGLGRGGLALTLLADAEAAEAGTDPYVQRLRGDILARSGDLDGAMAAYRQVSAPGVDAPAEAALALAGMADVHRRLADYKKAIALSRSALGLLEKLDRSADRATAHGVIGLCHYRLGQHTEALAEHGRAMALREAIGDVAGVARSLNNLAMIEGALDHFDAAQDCYSRSLAIWRKLGDRRNIGLVLNNLGDLMWLQRRGELAERHFREALKVAKRCGDRYTSVTATGSLADILAERGESAEALEYADRCLAQIEETGLGEHLADVRRIRGMALAGQGQFEAAERELAMAREAARKAGNAAFDAVVDRCLEKIAGSRSAAG
ncbi:MAG: tetratricopeptide repeat protein [Candidatus Sericytochromatia bacterium]|nr:tetratricopeptide repeat protein [Candidatus Tanganyikabacteria bacterium]